MENNQRAKMNIINKIKESPNNEVLQVLAELYEKGLNDGYQDDVDFLTHCVMYVRGIFIHMVI